MSVICFMFRDDCIILVSISAFSSSSNDNTVQFKADSDKNISLDTKIPRRKKI